MPQFKIEQVALYPVNPLAARLLLSNLGLSHWIHDTVVAAGEVFGEAGENTAHLSFNYQSGNGSDKEAGKPLELEVLHYADGPNWVDHQLEGATESTVSHLGMHVTEDQLQEFDAVFRKHNISIAQRVHTQSHTNEAIKDSRRYKYVIYNTRSIIGVDLKFIVRLPYTPAQ
jgi:hypothetical protein